MKAVVGLRVVRGPDWELRDKLGDGGEGFVGTVVEVGGTKGSKVVENKVWVQWDSGRRRDHRAGQYGKYYDLCVFDSSPAGITHDDSQCNCCGRSPILGMRWRCLDCDDYNLCTECYMADEHDREHMFERIDEYTSEGIPVGKRAGTAKIQAKGIFEGAKVKRGYDWKRGDEDGGKGKEGVVLEVTEYKGMPQSGAVVSWDFGEKDNYRLGYKGKVDLKCITPAVGGCYYKDHLQSLGRTPRKTKRKRFTEGSSSTREPPQEKSTFQVGDSVRVALEVDLVKDMCDVEGGGGWSSDMGAYVGKLGKVVKVRHNQVVIKYDDGATFGFHPDAVLPAKETGEVDVSTSQDSSKLRPGVLVKVMSDEDIVKTLLAASGLWEPSVSQYIGNAGEVKTVIGDGLVEVMMNESQPVVLNEAVLTTIDDKPSQRSRRSVPPETTAARLENVKALINSGVPVEELMKSGCLNDIVADLMERDDCPLSKDKSETGRLLVSSATDGNVTMVNGILNRYPDAVDFTYHCHTALHKASHSGDLEMISCLLDRKASLTKRDNQGYTALHHAAYGDYTGSAVSLLVGNGAGVNNNLNEALSTPLHLAVTQHNEAAVQSLVVCDGCDVNVQDAIGRTPLHHAVAKESLPIAEILLNAKGCSIQKEDQLGMNPFLLAVDAGYLWIVKIMLDKFPKIMTIPQQSHQMTALHFVALYDDVDMADMLLQSEFCDPKARNIDGLTPDELARAAGNEAVNELLSKVSLKAGGGYQITLSNNLKRLLSIRRRRFPVLQPGMDVRVKSDKRVVAVYQLGHGGWTTLLDLTRDQVGIVVEKVGSRDVRVQFAELQKEFTFNSAALEPVVTENTDYLPVQNYYREIAETPSLSGNPFTCLKGTTDDSGERQKAVVEEEEALFNAVLHECTDKVKEILAQNPELANYKNEGQPVLQVACAAQSVDLVSLLLDLGARVDTKDSEKFTALHYAVLGDRTGRLADFLLNAGANAIDNANTIEATPLHVAIARNNKPSFDRLLEESNCGLECQDVYWNTPLHEVARLDRDEMMQQLLLRPEVKPFAINKSGYTALHFAILQSNLANVNMLLQHSPVLASVLVQNSYAMSTLHLACLQPNVQILTALLNTELVSYRQLDNAERTPLFIAAGTNNTAITRKLLAVYDLKDAQSGHEHCEGREQIFAEEDDMERPLRIGDTVIVRANMEVMEALQKGHLLLDEKVLQVCGKVGQIQSVTKNGDFEVKVEDKTWLFNPLALIPCTRDESCSGRTISESDKEKETPLFDRMTAGWKLFHAIATCDVEMVKDILQTFPEFANVILYGMSPLHLACKDGFPSIVTALLYPDPATLETAVASSFGMTPLHLACFDALPDIINVLLHKGALTDATDDTGITPLHVAAAHDKTGLSASLLLEQGVNPNAIEVCNSRTPLHIAVLRNNKAVARAILAHDYLDVNQKDDEGNTALHLAVEESKNVFVDIITACKAVQPLTKNNLDHNVLHEAAQRGCTYAVKRLLECYPAMVNETTEDGFSALHIAATENQYEVAELILKTEGCEVNALNNMNQTAITLASLNGHTLLLQLLRKHGGVLDDNSLATTASTSKDERELPSSPSVYTDELSVASTSRVTEEEISGSVNSSRFKESDAASGYQSQSTLQMIGESRADDIDYSGSPLATRVIKTNEGEKSFSKDSTVKTARDSSGYLNTAVTIHQVVKDISSVKEPRAKQYTSALKFDIQPSSGNMPSSSSKHANKDNAAKCTSYTEKRISHEQEEIEKKLRENFVRKGQNGSSCQAVDGKSQYYHKKETWNTEGKNIECNGSETNNYKLEKPETKANEKENRSVSVKSDRGDGGTQEEDGDRKENDEILIHGNGESFEIENIKDIEGDAASYDNEERQEEDDDGEERREGGDDDNDEQEEEAEAEDDEEQENDSEEEHEIIDDDNDDGEQQAGDEGERENDDEEQRQEQEGSDDDDDDDEQEVETNHEQELEDDNEEEQDDDDEQEGDDDDDDDEGQEIDDDDDEVEDETEEEEELGGGEEIEVRELDQDTESEGDNQYRNSNGSSSSAYENQHSSSEESSTSDEDIFEERRQTKAKDKINKKGRQLPEEDEAGIWDNRYASSSSEESGRSDTMTCETDKKHDNRNITSDESDNEQPIRKHKSSKTSRYLSKKRTRETRFDDISNAKTSKATVTTRHVRKSSQLKGARGDKFSLCQICNRSRQHVLLQPCGHKACKGCLKKSHHCGNASQ